MWLRRRLAATALIRPLAWEPTYAVRAWEPPYAVGAGQENGKKTKKKKNNCIPPSNFTYQVKLHSKGMEIGK